MKSRYHREITRRALDGLLSPRALERVLAANLGQDALRYQIGHDHFHFDNNALEASQAYIEANRALIPPALERDDREAAWAAFGRLTHAAQDFYAHTNYISLYLARRRRISASPPDPKHVDALDPDLLASPNLCSGKVYYPLEALSFLPLLGRLVLPLLPRDSHAWMNLDGPERGPKFAYAFAAAVQRTRHEFERVRAALPRPLFSRFADLGRPNGRDAL